MQGIFKRTVSTEIEVHFQHFVGGELATHGSLRWSSVRFDLFRVDLSSGELFRSGVRVPIQDQPLQLLRLLLEAEGRVVTREQLRAALWPQNTFVDFEHAVNTAVKKLRQALEDPAEHPKFVETVPRIGYRFITTVEWVSDVSDKNPLPRVVAIAPPGPVTVTQKLPPRREAISGDKEQAATLLPGDAVAPETQREPRIRRLVLRYSILLAGILLLAGAAFKTVIRAPSAPRVLRFTALTNDGQGKGGALATDGSRIYFNETLIDQRPIIVQVSVTGGEAVPLSVPLKQPQVLDLSREGTELLIANDDGFESSSLWVQSVVGGSPRRIGAVTITDAQFGADGKSIIYGSGHDVLSVSRDGSSGRKLLTADSVPFGFRFSPDGRTFRFTEFDYRVDSMAIMEAAADGTRLHKMTGGCCGEWTSDGRFFIFQTRSDPADLRIDLWALPEEARFSWRKREGKPIQLTAGPLSFMSPLLSKDGKQIFAIGASSRAEVIRYDSRSKQFVPYFSGISAEGLAFSRDGQWVTYTSYPNGTLWRSKVDGSERLQLTFPPLRVLLPRWSPDGRQIAFNARLHDAPFNIYVISSEGGQAQRILPSEQNQGDANWSPDGNSLVFGSGDISNKKPIQTINLGSKRVSALPESSGLFSPRWSPDGRYIAAVTKEHPFKLMLLDFSTQKWAEAFGSEMSYPSWSHDGKYIYFQNWHDPVKHIGERIVRLRLSDHKVENIVDVKDVGRLTTGTNIDWFGLAPDDSPLFARDISTSEIFALDVEWP
jgi:Tol biopolymer transport system component/DNA-binding winged helix-turn-helix (wHTH) protein